MDRKWQLTIDYLLDAPHPHDQALVARYQEGTASAADLLIIERLAELLFGDWAFDKPRFEQPGLGRFAHSQNGRKS